MSSVSPVLPFRFQASFKGYRYCLCKVERFDGGLSPNQSSSRVMTSERIGELSTRVSSSTRPLRVHFSGTDRDRAYIQGLRAGDLYVVGRGNCIRVTVSSTHPAMLALMDRLFGKYGRVLVRPKFIRKWMNFEWESDVYLDSSFNFMLRKPEFIPEPFMDFFAGFFDAEGCITIKRQSGSCTTNISLELANNNLPLLELCRDRLCGLGYHAGICPKPYHRAGDFVGFGRYNKDCYRLGLYRRGEVNSLLSSLDFQHDERKRKKALALACSNNTWEDASPKVAKFRSQLRQEVSKSVADAREAYLGRNLRSSTRSPVV